MDVTNPGIITHNIWGNDLVGQVKRNGSLTRYYHLKDHLGSVRVTVDASGNSVAYDDYDPWGMLMDGRSYNAGQADNRYKFTAKEKDTETGNDWLDSRGYDSRIGRFFCVDALSELFPGHSSYSYSFNNPISFSDANGMSPDSVNGEAEFPRIVEMEPVEVRADIVPVRYLAVTPLTPRHFIQNLFSSGEVGSQRTYSQENGRWWSYIDLRNQIQVNNMVLPEWVGAVGPSGILSGLRRASIALMTRRAALLGQVTNPKLKGIINELYRIGAKIGNGGTADAVRYEQATGILLSKEGHVLT